MNLTNLLTAVNIVLRMAGLPRVNTLSDDSEVVTIRDLLYETSLAHQTKGWYWNTITTTIQPDVNGEIVLPSNTIRADPTSVLENHLVQRGLRLYDPQRMTKNIGKPVSVTIVQHLDFDEVPEVFRRYITVRSGQLFQQEFVGSPQLDAFNQGLVEEAWNDMQADDTDRSDYNFFNNEEGQYHMDRSIRRLY